MEKGELENLTRRYVQSLRPGSRLEFSDNSYCIVWGINHGSPQPDPTLAWLAAAKQIIDNEIGKLLY